ncbi:aldose 1-epimerase family protein [Prevotella disiens]
MEQLANDYLTLQLSAHGAELKSIKDDNGKEYLWQGDAQYWARQSPILFPHVGSVWNNSYKIENKEYSSSRHGFARDMDFKVTQKSTDRILFSLHDTPETYERYPYHFILGVSYRLKGNRIHVIWHVQNIDNKEIHFQIGGHPAFNLPDMKAGEPIKGYLKLDNETLQRNNFTHEGYLLEGYKTFETDEGILELTPETFANDALIFDQCQLHHVQILNKKGAAEVSVQFNTPAVGIWSPAGKSAPFVCIEPWYGIADKENYNGEFCNRYLMNHLQPGASFMSEYIITIR